MLKLKPCKSFNLNIDGVNIKQVFTLIYLGIIFDSDLTWKNLVIELHLKLSKL